MPQLARTRLAIFSPRTHVKYRAPVLVKSAKDTGGALRQLRMDRHRLKLPHIFPVSLSIRTFIVIIQHKARVGHSRNLPLLEG